MHSGYFTLKFIGLGTILSRPIRVTVMGYFLLSRWERNLMFFRHIASVGGGLCSLISSS